MVRYLKHALILSACTLTSCSTIYGPHGIIQNRGKDYLAATSIAPLKIPPGLSSSTIQQHYPVSERQYPESEKEVKLIPPNLSSINLKVKEQQVTPAGMVHEQSTMARKASSEQTPTTKTVVSKEVSAPSQAQIAIHKPASATKPLTTENPTYVNKQSSGRTSPNPVDSGFTAQATDLSVTPKQRAQAESHYYDSYTRSSTGGVGSPIRSVVSKIIPHGSHSASQDSSLFGKPATEGAPITPVAVNSEQTKSKTASTSEPSNESPNVISKSLGSIVKSIWPWSKSNESAPYSQTQSTTTEAAVASNGNSTNVPSQSLQQKSKMPNMYFDRYTRR